MKEKKPTNIWLWFDTKLNKNDCKIDFVLSGKEQINFYIS